MKTLRTVFAIAGREIRAGFANPSWYVLGASFLVLSGFFFFSILGQFNGLLQKAALLQELRPSLNDQVVQPYYRVLEALLLFLVPLLTMRSLAEERRSGTFELLMTSPVSPVEIVWGKLVAVAVMLLGMLLLAFVFPVVLIFQSNPEVGPIVVGLVGLLLFAWSYASLGIAISCFTNSQMVAGVLTVVLLVLLHIIDAPAQQLGGGISAVLTYLAPPNHVQNMLKGVIESQDVVYLFSVIAVGVFAACRALDAERWR